MKIEELLEINSKLKRRLLKVRRGQQVELCTSKEKIVNVEFHSVDIHHPVILSDNLERLSNPKKCFYTQLGKNGKQFITKQEANIILGHDYLTATEDEDIQAMLEAVEGGVGSCHANAYFLGGSYTQTKGVSTISVVYFKIPNKIHKSLVINRKDKEFSELIKQLEE